MTSARLKAITFNAYHGYPLCAHIERRLALLEDGIVAEKPDIVLLQEMSSSVLHGHVAERLVGGLRSRGLRYAMVYEAANGSLRGGGGFEEGSAILSRHPIVAAESRRLAPDCAVWRDYHGYRYEEFRIALRATIEIAAGIRIDVFGAHVTDAPPTDDFAARKRQIEDLAALVDARPSQTTPAIVGGDLNAPPDAAEIRGLRARGFRDVCEDIDPGPTNDRSDRDLENPVDTANQRIDHLFVAGAARLCSVRRFLDRAFEVEPGRHLWASDHSGLVAEVDLWIE